MTVLFAGGLMAAEQGWYMGIESGFAIGTLKMTKMDETNSLYDTERRHHTTFSDVKLKLGKGRDGDIKFQGALSFVRFGEYPFSIRTKQVTEGSVEIIKEFDAGNLFYPFVKAGLGIGYMGVEGYSTSRIQEVCYNMGAGLSYKTADHLYLLAGIDFVGKIWEEFYIYDPKVNKVTVESIDMGGFKPYIGVNYRF
jgi:hypothetical protein